MTTLRLDKTDLTPSLTPSLTPRMMREFALVVSIGFLLLFTALPWALRKSPQLWPLALASALGAVAAVQPLWLAPAYRLWMRIGLVLGWINSRIILGIFFFAVITPIGLVMRLLGNDPLRLRADPSLKTYRTPSRARAAQSMERPY